MKKLLLTLAISCTFLRLNAQELTAGYKLVGEIQSSRFSSLGDVLLSPDGEYLVTEFGYKPTTIEVYEIKEWKKVRTFTIKGWTYFFNGFFDEKNTDIVYLGSRARKMHKLNLSNGDYEHVKIKDMPDGSHDNVYSYWKDGERSKFQKDDAFIHMLPEKYIIKVYEGSAKIYIWEGLLK